MAPESPPLLRTPRLLVRRFVFDDLPVIARVLDACFAAAPQERRSAWLSWTIAGYDALADLHQPPYGDRAVMRSDTGELIGSVGLVPSFAPFEKLPYFRDRLASPSQDARERFVPEMGLFWAIAPEHRRQGFAAEAARALAEWAAGHLRAQRLVATTQRSNRASVGVMRRLGMIVQENPDPEPTWFQVIGILSLRGFSTNQEPS